MRVSYERIVHYVYHHHIGIILVALALSVAAGSFAVQLRIKADSADLLPDGYTSVRELNRIKERVGGIGPSMVIVTGSDLQRCVDFMLVLADSLERNPLISSVIRGKSTGFFSRNRLLYMETGGSRGDPPPRRGPRRAGKTEALPPLLRVRRRGRGRPRLQRHRAQVRRASGQRPRQGLLPDRGEETG